MAKVPNVYKDSKRGTWYFVASLGTDATGKRVRVKRRGFATQAEAKAALDRVLSESRKGSRRADSSMAFGEFYRVYFEPEYRARVRPSTFEVRSALMRRQFARFEDVPLSKFDAALLVRWQNWLTDNYSNGYARLVFGCMQMALDSAVRVGLLGGNVARKVGNVRKRKREFAVWSREDFERVVSTFDVSDYYQAFGRMAVWTLYMTGLRIGEFQAVTWERVDFDARTLRVAGSMWFKNSRDWEIGPTKTPAGVRTVTLDSTTLEVLRGWKAEQAKNCPSRFVFSYDGAPASKSTLARVIKRHAALAGVQRIRVHDLRHSHAALLVSLGENALAIRDRLGHEDVETTLGTYGHLFENANYQVAARLDAAFAGSDKAGKGAYGEKSPSDG